MPRRARRVYPIPEKSLEEAATEFLASALKALEGEIRNQRELAARLNWPETSLSSALQGRFTFKTWPRICRALDRDPIDELVRGRDLLREELEVARAEQQAARELTYREMLERAQADTMVALWRTLPSAERARVADVLAAERPTSSGVGRASDGIARDGRPSGVALPSR